MSGPGLAQRRVTLQLGVVAVAADGPRQVIGTGRRTGIWGGRRAGIAELTTDLVVQLDADDMFRAAPRRGDA
ncbi:glycosyltransferase family 2 protein [Streptomyces sp. NBC_01527]|uniref:glycosyltransferase family A protein n=1 Tax=Streptomyces sp. NBC_01527 TaxID=2903894 RepID=UPI003865DC2B